MGSTPVTGSIFYKGFLKSESPFLLQNSTLVRVWSSSASAKWFVGYCWLLRRCTILLTMPDPIIIDPPVGPYSLMAEIEAWIRELQAMPASATRDACLREAKAWLEDRPGRNTERKK